MVRELLVGIYPFAQSFNLVALVWVAMKRGWANDDAVTPLVASLLLLGVVAILAASVMYLGQDLGANAGKLSMGYVFDHDLAQGTVDVVRAPDGVPWKQLDVQGCAAVPTGLVSAGDTVSGCSGHVTIRDVEANFVLFDRQFP